MRHTMGAISEARTLTLPGHHLKGHPHISGINVIPFLVLLTVVRILVFNYYFASLLIDRF